MDLEERNKKERSNASLTKEEWLTFLFSPFYSTNRIGLDTNTFNETEEERFKKFGFHQKYKEAQQARSYGCFLYIFVFLLIVIIINW
ncbi:hypothetical protein Q2T40_10830 [Winogradskyella maritima]|uniref:Uncharacterized protein n=1 Tax=Winogradskyella maritima TaxID=1517766 RepID=A0ABV8AMP5_9FLAO|nr:hypothetical protein [Winogradskyella maritima]